MELVLLDGRSSLRLGGLQSVVAQDASGQFGIRPGHEALLTVLEPGLLRCCGEDGQWRTLATSGGALVCRGNRLQLVCARFLLAEDEQDLLAQLAAEQRRESGEGRVRRQSWAEMEREMVKWLNAWSEAKRR